jgi:phosphoribosyl-ATP pyrophosphohydrolase/phosphoribosyl-AMP cyclohydrolase
VTSESRSEADSQRGALRAAIIQDVTSQRVLMLGWMDDEAFRLTEVTGTVHFYSRSRRQLWRKGDTSGNSFTVESLQLDCDGDAVLVQVKPEGPACHTGSSSCFSPWLWQRVLDRIQHPDDASYVSGLVASGLSRVAQKVGEEGVEVALASSGDRDALISEVADLWFHIYVLLGARGIDVTEVDDELRRRARPASDT